MMLRTRNPLAGPMGNALSRPMGMRTASLGAPSVAPRMLVNPAPGRQMRPTIARVQCPSCGTVHAVNLGPRV